MAWTVTPSGAGTAGDPWQITTILQMEEIGTDGHMAENFILMNDIDASETKTWHYNTTTKKYFGFDPIGTSGSGLSGNFDGNDKTISNLYIYRPTVDAVALFASIALGAGKEIKDLTISNADITGNCMSAIFCGYAYGSAVVTITNCHVSGTITSYGTRSGGFVGSDGTGANAVTFSGCSSNVSITAVGAGYMTGGTTASIGGFGGYIPTIVQCSNCHSSGSVIYSGTIAEANVTNIQLGGFAGFAGNSTNCYSTCVVMNTTWVGATGDIVYMGGFAGLTSRASTLCYATGDVTSVTSSPCTAGGFAGDCTVESKCMASGSVYAKLSTSLVAGGFAGLGGASTDCYARGDICKDGMADATAKVGGFVGDCEGINTRCYSAGYVNPGSSSSGGFIGRWTSGAPSLCHWDTESSGMTTGQGSGTAQTNVTGHTTLEMQDITTYTSWDFDTIWQSTTGTQSAIAVSNLTCWLSRTGDYEVFESGVKDDDSFQLTIPSTNEIRWIESMESLVVGTAGDEWKIGSNKLGTPLSPTNFGVKLQTSHGSALIQSIRVNEVILFVDYVRRKLREMTYDGGSEKYICPDMTSLAEHITEGGIKWMAYQRNPDSILWCGLQTGEVKVFVYDREQNVLAWANMPLGGDGIAQSGCVLPGETEDVIYLVVNRINPGNLVYYGDEQVLYGTEPVIDGYREAVFIEKISSRTFATAADAFFVDCGVSFETPGGYVDEDVYYGTEQVYYGTEPVVYAVFDSTAPVSTITGLDHLDGETVKVLGDGVRLDDEVVSGGQITPHLNGVITPVFKASVGLDPVAKLCPQRIVVNTPSGSSMGKTMRVNGLMISFLLTGAAKYGISLDNLIPIDFTSPKCIENNSCTITGLYTGEISVPVPGGFNELTPIFIVSDGPSPLTVRCIVPEVERTG